jgi:hypothetical protein
MPVVTRLVEVAMLTTLLLASQARHAPIALDPGEASAEVLGRAAQDGVTGRSNWLGLYRSGEGWRIERAKVEVTSGQDGDMPFYRIAAEPDSPRLLLSGVPGVVPGPATTASEAVSLSHEVRSVGITLGTRRYTVTLVSASEDYCDAVVTLATGRVRQTLYEPRTAGRTADPDVVLSCDEPHFEVRWAGDIDRDGRLDLLTTFSPKYSYYPQRLWLSSRAVPCLQPRPVMSPCSQACSCSLPVKGCRRCLPRPRNRPRACRSTSTRTSKANPR